MGGGAARALVVAGFVAGVGCSTVLGVDADRYLAVGKDAASGVAMVGLRDAGDDGGLVASRDGSEDAPRDPWDCLNRPPEELDPDLHVDLKVQVMDAIQPSTSAGAVDGGSDLDTVAGAWLSGVAVRHCAMLDPDCLNASNAVLTSEAGVAEFDLTGDFSGFFDLRRSDLVPTTLYPGHLLAGEPTASFPAYAIQPMEIQDLGLSADTTVILDPDAGVGHAVVTIYDCEDHQAQGVAVTYSLTGPKAVPFYFVGGLPSTAATETDDFGLAGVVNVPVGTMRVQATLASNRTPVGSATFDVRPGALTLAWIRVRSH